MGKAELQIEKKQGVAVIVGSGDYSQSADVADLEKAYREARAAGMTRVIWDAGDVGLVTSTTLGTLIRMHKDLLNAGGRLVIVPTPFLRRVLGETSMDQILRLADSLPAARQIAAG